VRFRSGPRWWEGVVAAKRTIRSVGSCTRRGVKPMIQGDAVAGSTQFRRKAASGSTENEAAKNGIADGLETQVKSQVNGHGISLSVLSDLQ
jgi:hypothetical protein